MDTEILSGRNSEALTADVLIVGFNCGLVTQIRIAVKIVLPQIIEQYKRKRNTGMLRLRLLVIMSLSCFDVGEE